MRIRTLYSLAATAALGAVLLSGAACNRNGESGWPKLSWPGGDDSEAETDRAEVDDTRTADGDYTILLYVDAGPGHIARIREYRERTESDAGWDDLQVVHKTGRSELYRGHYSSAAAAAEALAEAKAYRTPAGVNIFAKAVVVPVPGADAGHAADHRLAAADGAYSVLVAVFYDVPDADYVGRREKAVAYCRQLRAEGHEAYYHHGSSRSSVTVGSFPADAVETVKVGAEFKQRLIDPAMRAVMSEFEFLAVNGRRHKVRAPDIKGREAQWVEVRCYPVKIPREKGFGGAANAGAGDTQSR